MPRLPQLDLERVLACISWAGGAVLARSSQFPLPARLARAVRAAAAPRLPRVSRDWVEANEKETAKHPDAV